MQVLGWSFGASLLIGLGRNQGQNEQTQFVTLPEVALSLFEKLSRTDRTFPG